MDGHYQKYGKAWSKANPEKRRKIARRFYLKHRDKILAKRRAWAKNRQDMVRDFKLVAGCQVCKYNKSASALCFHHEDDNKEFQIGGNVGNTAISTLKLLKEMEKCVVLCRNCHAELHEERGEYA